MRSWKVAATAGLALLFGGCTCFVSVGNDTDGGGIDAGLTSDAGTCQPGWCGAWPGCFPNGGCADLPGFLCRNGSFIASCGDGVCNCGETASSCPSDCAGHDAGGNDAGAVDGGVCPTGWCGAWPGCVPSGSCAEAPGYLCRDGSFVPSCGDGLCDCGESAASCPADCGHPPDGGSGCTGGATLPTPGACGFPDGGANFPSLNDCCNTASDCTFGVDQYLCCGDMEAVGINTSVAADFYTALGQWSCALCECASGGVHTQDGNTLSGTAGVTVSCDQGRCMTHAGSVTCQPDGVQCVTSSDCCSGSFCLTRGNPLLGVCCVNGGCP